ncbi:hypothetical protein NIES4071_97260 [Calothrix sp. NIES-4071]|nr:hypothetical protein NIES4071_97260 [Calothrix sp. NIES-4071]BAZ63991.1 hypothetical protein NIES4105_97190 [Calothrix sp. NIES-4105]
MINFINIMFLLTNRKGRKKRKERKGEESIIRLCRRVRYGMKQLKTKQKI